MPQPYTVYVTSEAVFAAVSLTDTDTREKNRIITQAKTTQQTRTTEHTNTNCLLPTTLGQEMECMAYSTAL